MLRTSTGASAILTPSQVHELLVLPVLSASIAAQVSTIVNVTSGSYRVPFVSADASAQWVAEGAEITASDPTLNELTVTPSKIAGLTVISSELANDSSPAAAEAVGASLARDIARKVDAAYFGSLAAPAPSGLAALAGVTAVSAGTTYANVDPFSEAIAAAENVGATLDSFVCGPATALTLAKVKKATGSNEPLLAQGGDATTATRRQVAGVPLYVSPAITGSTVWGLSRDRSLLVVREDAEVTSDASVFYTSDRVAVRAIARLGFGWPHAAAVVKVSTTT